MKKCILVLSPPRSGSSCTTACLNIAGISLGKNITEVKDQFNPKGYFENKKILQFNEKVLQSIQLNILNSIVLNPAQIEETLKFKKDLAEIIEKEFETSLFAIKDARISILQELYKEAFKEINIHYIAIKLRRAIIPTAMSINRLLSTPIEQAKQTCAGYYQIINKMAKEVPNIEISFEELLRQPVETTKRICEFAGIILNEGKKASIQHFVDKNLVNFKLPK